MVQCSVVTRQSQTASRGSSATDRSINCQHQLQSAAESHPDQHIAAGQGHPCHASLEASSSWGTACHPADL